MTRYPVVSWLSMFVVGCVVRTPLCSAGGDRLPKSGRSSSTIHIRHIPFSSFVSRSIEICRVENRKQLFKELGVLQGQTRQNASGEATIYLDRERMRSKVSVEYARMTFARTPSPKSDREVLNQFAPKDSIALLQATLSRARAYQNRQNQPNSGTTNPLKKVEIFIGITHDPTLFGNNGLPYLELHLSFKEGDSKLVFSSIFASASQKGKKWLVGKKYLVQEQNSDGGIVPNPGEDAIEDGWSGIFSPCAEIGAF